MANQSKTDLVPQRAVRRNKVYESSVQALRVLIREDWRPGYIMMVGVALVDPIARRVEKLHAVNTRERQSLQVPSAELDLVRKCIISYDGTHATFVLDKQPHAIGQVKRPAFLAVAPVAVDSTECRYVLLWALSARESSSGMGPLAFRWLAQAVDMRIALPAGLDESCGMALGFAMSKQWEEVLVRVKRICGAGAVIVWEYSFRRRMYSSALKEGLTLPWKSQDFKVRLGGTLTAGGKLEGFVGLVQPERPFIFYSTVDQSARWPLIRNWVEHDAGFMEENGFTEFAGWPIALGGELLGAVTVYSAGPGSLRIDKCRRDTISAMFAEYLRALESERRIEAVDDEYDSANTAITVGEIASDFIHDGRESIERLALAWPHLTLKQGRDAAAKAVVRDADREIHYLAEMFKGLAELREVRRQRWRCEPYALIKSRRLFFEGVVGAIGDGLPLRLALSKDTAGLEVPMDELTFVRVLLNLLKNAARWTRGVRGGSVVLSCSAEEGERGIIVRVQDNGVGIPDAIQSQVWDRFFSERKAEGGTGLGLHYVRRQVEKVGGMADVSSSPGAGAVFSIALPVGLQNATRG